MKAILFTALLSMFSMFAQADDVLYSWQAPTTRTDGSPITGSKSYVLVVKKNSETPVVYETATLSQVVNNVSSGDTLVAKIATKEGSLQSPFSSEVVTPIPFYPAPPSDLQGTHVSVTFNVNINTQ